MFTGIVESMGEIIKIEPTGTNLSFWINSPISHELKVDQSLSHDGVCLTVEAKTPEGHRVSAVLETLDKTTLGSWKAGQKVNLERAMVLGGRLDGHLVQGHVDATALCLSKESLDGSWLYRFEFPPSFARLVIEKGSVCINGISLTAFNVSEKAFSVAIIPYTYFNTGIGDVKPGDMVNIEFDLIGKYINRWKDIDNQAINDSLKKQ